MLRFALTLFVVLNFSLAAFNQAADTKICLLGEFSKDKDGEQIQNLVGLYFKNGVFIKKDTIVSGPTFRKFKKNDYSPFFRLEFGNEIYRDRYLITFRGPVVDIKKRLIYEVDGELIDRKADTLVFFTENIFRGNYYTYLALSTGGTSRKYIENYKRDYTNPYFSPDKKLAIQVDYSKLQYKIILRKKGSEDTIVANAGYGSPIRDGSSFPAVPICWIDSSRFVYGRFDRLPRQAAYAASVILYDTRFKSEAIITSIGIVEESPVNAKFFNDPDDGLVFRTSRALWQIDLDSFQARKLDRLSLHNGFAADFYIDSDWKQRLYYANQEIGNFHHIGSFTTNNYIAVGIRDKGVYTGADRIGIWNSFTKSWRIFEEPQLIEMIGWINGD